MLDNFSIYVRYYVDDAKKAVISEDVENDDYIITASKLDVNRLVLDIAPKDGKTLTIEEFSVIYSYDYLPRFKQFQRIYAGGYQSWSMSREYFVDEHVPVYKPKGLDANTGDYNFATESKVGGTFRSTSYTYLRNNDDIELFASMNEKSGFTTFYMDVVKRELKATKDVEGITIENRYEIMNIIRYYGEYNAVFDKWFKDMGIEKPREKHAIGYTTWYNHYAKITEDIVMKDLDAIASLDKNVDIFQIDDGYESAIGDWLVPKKEFNDMAAIADAIHDKKMKAGIWLSPFAAGEKSDLLKDHPDWMVCDDKGKPIKAGNNWGGFYTLDIYRDEVVDYLTDVFKTIFDDWHYNMVKLDFLYQVAITPYNGKTRGEIMTDAMDLLRKLCGGHTILGCGVPLYPAFGKVDYCRIGPDMDLVWKGAKGNREAVSTVNAINNAVFRRHLDGRAFVNDPDVFILRDNNNKLTRNEKTIIANINKIFGNLIFTSDNVGKYKKDWQKELLDLMFGEDDIKIMGAEYVTNNILHIKYYINNTPTLFTLDMKKGTMFKQEVDESDLRVSDIDDKLTARGGMDYEDALSSEDDNYDDFDFDRELTEEEKAEIAEQKKRAEEARQKKIEEMIAKKKAEKEELKAKREAEKAERLAKLSLKKKPPVATDAVEEPSAPVVAPVSEDKAAEIIASAKPVEEKKVEVTPAPKAEPEKPVAPAKPIEEKKVEPAPAPKAEPEKPVTPAKPAEEKKVEPAPAPKAEPAKPVTPAKPAAAPAPKTAPAKPAAAPAPKAVAPTAPAPKGAPKRATAPTPAPAPAPTHAPAPAPTKK